MSRKTPAKPEQAAGHCVNYAESESDENDIDDLEKSASSTLSSTSSLEPNKATTYSTCSGNITNMVATRDRGQDCTPVVKMAAKGHSSPGTPGHGDGNGSVSRRHYAAREPDEPKCEAKASKAIASRNAKGTETINDEIDKLSKKLKKLEARLDRNDKKADQELRKVCLKKGDSDRSAVDSAIGRSLPGLQRSRTDFVAPRVDIGASVASFDDSFRSRLDQKGSSDSKRFKKRSESANRKPSSSLGQRLQKSSTSVFRAATSSIHNIPSLLLPHLKSEKKSSQVYSSMDSMNSSMSALGHPEDMVFYAKPRKSPLKALGSFVDDKFFKGRLGSSKGSRSNLNTSLGGSSSHMQSLSHEESSSRTRSLALEHDQHNCVPSNSELAANLDDVFEVSRRCTVGGSEDIGPKSRSSSVQGRKNRAFSTPNSRELVQVLSKPLLIDDDFDSANSRSSLSSTGPEAQACSLNLRTQINPDALAEIEAFEKFTVNCFTKGSV